MDDAAPGMLYLLGKYPDDIVITFNTDINYPSVPVNDIPPVTVPVNSPDFLMQVYNQNLFNLALFQSVKVSHKPVVQHLKGNAVDDHPELEWLSGVTDHQTFMKFNK